MSTGPDNAETIPLFKQLKAREDEAKLSLHELRVFVATVQFGMTEVGRFGRALKQYQENPGIVANRTINGWPKKFIKEVVARRA